MKKLSKLTALLLALVLALGVPLQVWAESTETVDTWTEYMDIAKAALKAKIMAYETYGEYWEMAKLIENSDFEEFFYTLPLDDQHAIAKYVNDMFWASLVGYSNVAPFPELVETAESASTFSLIARDGETDTETKDNGLYTSKTVSEPDTNGYYTITLENYATGEVTTSTTTEIKPVDIVLVLDDSGSMADSFDANSSTEYTYTEVAFASLDETKTYYVESSSSWDDGYTSVSWCATCDDWTTGCWDWGGDWGHQRGTIYDSDDIFYERTDNSKGSALITAVNNFVDSVNANQPTEGTHQMSIVKFSGQSNNTNAASVLNEWTTVSDSTVGALKLTGDDMAFNGGTWINQGLSKAKTQLESLTTAGRQRVVIVFTDGKPGTGYWSSERGDAESVGASAIGIANSIKDMENTTIYTVAVLQGASPTSAVVSSATGNDDKINAILHAISSNYPDATASSSGSTLTTNFGKINSLVDTNNNGQFDDGEPGYYLSASSASELENIFQEISNNIQSGSSSVTLDETTIVRDVVTPYFEIPYVYVTDENGEKIKDYTAAEITIQTADYAVDAVGNTYFKDPVTADYTYTVDGNILDVTGFDFSANACMVVNGGAQGKKLIITFKIKPVAGFLGGNTIDTNEATSGIYEVVDGVESPFEGFEQPKVDIQVPDLEIVADDQHIYLGNYADLDELLQSFSVTYNIVDGNDNKVSGTHTVDTILNHYTELVFTLKDKDGKVLATYTIDDAKDSGTWTYAGDWANEMGEGNKTLKLLLTEDTPFYITYTATSASNPENNSTGKLTAWVYVYTPEVTFQDSVEQYMATVDEATQTAYYEGNNKLYTYSTTTSTDAEGQTITTVTTENVKWYHTATDGTKTVASTQMSGLEPKLTFTYTEVEDDEKEWLSNKQVTATEDVEVTVTTTITGDTTLYGDQAKAKYIRNKVTTCPDGCKAPDTYVANTADEPAFVVHIIDVYGSLTITKTVTGDGASADDTFLFTITGPGITGEMQVILKGGESVTINNLKIGDYTVTEETSWSWRYTCSTSKLTKAVASKTSTEFQFTNNLETKTWLDGNAHADNDFNQTTTEEGGATDENAN